MQTTKTRPSKSTHRRIGSLSFLVCVLSLFILGWQGRYAIAQNAVVLVGSGSSVPAPLYNRWTLEYGKRSSAIQMRYLPVGTSEGIKQISHSAGDFGAGESQLTEKERKEGNLIELPVRSHRHRSHLQLTGRAPGPSSFRRAAGADFSGRRKDVECAADCEA